MPTALDGMLKSKNLVLAFGWTVAAAAAWSIFGGEIFPAESDPQGDPNSWTKEEMRRWLDNRKLFPHATATREELLARILDNMRSPRH